MGLIIHLCGVVAAGVLASTIVALSQHGSKAGSNDKSVNCNSFVHAWPESSETAAEDCRREGCIRHRLTLARQDRPKPHASRARLPEGVDLLWASPRGKAMTTVIRGIVGGPYHPPLWRCHSTGWGYRRCDVVTAGVLTGQLIAIVLCTHGQRAVEQRPSIAAARGVSDTVSHWRTMTVRNHRPGCQRGLVFYGPVQGEKAMTTVIRGIVGWPYHPPSWRCHSTDWGYRGSAQSLDRASSHHFFVGWRKGPGRFDFGFGCGVGRHCEEFLHKASCIILSSVFSVEGGDWGGSTSGSASGSLGIANNFRAKPRNLFLFGGKGGWVRFDFGFGFWFGGHCEQYLHKSGASSHQTVFFGRGGVGGVGGLGGLGGFDCGFGFGFVGHCEQFSDKGRCIIVATFFFGGGVGEVRLRFGFGFGGRSEQCLYKARCIIPACKPFFF